MRNNQAGILAMLISIFFTSVLVDQVSKIHAETRLLKFENKEDVKVYQGTSKPVFKMGALREHSWGAFFGFTYVRNQGAAWGFLNNWDDRYRIPFFYAVTFIAIIMIGLFFRSTPPSHSLARLALTLVLSGAIGNAIDRLRLGYVIDWIDVKWNIAGWYYDFPMFNYADSCITVGVALLLFDMFVLDGKRAALKEKTA